MRTFTAILLGKLIARLSRLFKIGGGMAAPGLYALKVDPDLIQKLITQIIKNVVITGTNGKTTTARMLAHFAKESGLKVIRNHTGSNLERGIASTLISATHLTHPKGVAGRHLRDSLGIWELDEAAFNSVAQKIKPDIVVFLNVFRDQLDRYGEVDSVIKKWAQTLEKLPKETIVLVNGDDANTKKLKSSFKGHVYQFGVKDYKIAGEGILHKKKIENLDFEARNVRLNGLNGSSFQFSKYNGRQILKISLPVPGLYHIYDALAALACGITLGFDPNDMASSIATFSPAFGRVEKLVLSDSKGSHPCFIFLIKNPVGATQVLQTLASELKPDDRLLLALNDNLADGTDVSWIWDVNFEQLTNHKDSQKSAGAATNPPQGWTVAISGVRAYDLANRLKYAGLPSYGLSTSDVEPNIKEAFKRAQNGLKGRLFILPTYTALLNLQKILTKQGLKKHYWEEN